MTDFEIIRCDNPYQIDADAVLITKLNEDVIDSERVVRGMKVVNHCDEDSEILEKMGCNPKIKSLVQIEQTIDYMDSYFTLSDIDYYNSTLRECVNLLRDSEIFIDYPDPYSIALPVVSFRDVAGEMLDDIHEEPMEFLFQIVLELYCSKSLGKIYLYLADKNLDIEKVKEKFSDYIKNTILIDYEKELEIKQTDEAEKSSKIEAAPDFQKESADDEAEEVMSREDENRYKDRNIPLDDYIEKYSGKAFTEFINDYLNKENIKTSKLYKDAQISKQDFSRMISAGAAPKKQEKQKYDTVAILISSHLKITKFRKALASRGFSLSDCRKKDLIIEYFILNGNYNLMEINAELEKRKLPVIGNSIK